MNPNLSTSKSDFLPLFFKRICNAVYGGKTNSKNLNLTLRNVSIRKASGNHAERDSLVLYI